LGKIPDVGRGGDARVEVVNCRLELGRTFSWVHPKAVAHIPKEMRILLNDVRVEKEHAVKVVGEYS
jgi:hypothetical protein